jgi:hypothetical protein
MKLLADAVVSILIETGYKFNVIAWTPGCCFNKLLKLRSVLMPAFISDKYSSINAASSVTELSGF